MGIYKNANKCSRSIRIGNIEMIYIYIDHLKNDKYKNYKNITIRLQKNIILKIS